MGVLRVTDDTANRRTRTVAEPTTDPVSLWTSISAALGVTGLSIREWLKWRKERAERQDMQAEADERARLHSRLSTVERQLSDVRVTVDDMKDSVDKLVVTSETLPDRIQTVCLDVMLKIKELGK